MKKRNTHQVNKPTKRFESKKNPCKSAFGDPCHPRSNSAPIELKCLVSPQSDKHLHKNYTKELEQYESHWVLSNLLQHLLWSLHRKGLYLVRALRYLIVNLFLLGFSA